jgi:hypothetical protein
LTTAPSNKHGWCHPGPTTGRVESEAFLASHRHWARYCHAREGRSHLGLHPLRGGSGVRVL